MADMKKGVPVFQQVLGADWERLGAVIRRHYFLRPYSDDRITVRGVMHQIHHSGVAKLLIPFGLLFGAIVPYRRKNVPIDVHYNCRRDDACIYWDRVFHLASHRDFHFRSHMARTQANEVIEFVRFGVGMRLVVSAEDGALVFRSAGYVWRLFGRYLPIPLGLLFGAAYVEERPIDDARFSMCMVIRHPLAGVLFRYDATFALPPSETHDPS